MTNYITKFQPKNHKQMKKRLLALMSLALISTASMAETSVESPIETKKIEVQDDCTISMTAEVTVLWIMTITVTASCTEPSCEAASTCAANGLKSAKSAVKTLFRRDDSASLESIEQSY
jgi:hypothetical protein